MLDKTVLLEISEILTPEQLLQSRSVHIEVQNGYSYGKVIFTSPNTELLTELRNDLKDITEDSIDSVKISTKSGKSAVIIASKITEDLKSKGIEVTQSEKAFR